MHTRRSKGMAYHARWHILETRHAKAKSDLLQKWAPTIRWLIHVGCLQMKLLIKYFQASSLIFFPHSHRVSPGTVMNSHLYLPRSSNTSELLAGASQRLWISAHREMKQGRRSGDWSTSHPYQMCNGSWSDVLHTGPCGLRLWAAKD